MSNSEIADQAAEYMRLALPLMKRHGVALTPENYTIWYEHVSGSNEALSEAINSLLASSASLSEKQSNELYDKFFNAAKERSEVVLMRKELTRALKEVIGFVHNSVSKTSTVNSQLHSLMSKISTNMSPQELHEVVEEILLETRVAVNSGELLTERLTVAMQEVRELRQEVDKTRRESKTDTLTGLANRKAFDELLNKVTRDSDESGIDVCLIFGDLDLFKNINDKHGHLVGDQVLRVVANSLRDSVKGRDLVSRYGGEEFAIILLNTSLQNAKILAENIRQEISAKKIQRKDTRESLGDITMSFGVARYSRQEGVDSFMQRADRALYMSKRKGRNSVSEAPPPII
jgi:diguanylate cyclase